VVRIEGIEMTEGSGLNFSFQGEGLVIPPKPKECQGCDTDLGSHIPLRPYRVKFNDAEAVGEPKLQVAWWCDECRDMAQMQEEIFETIHLIQDDGSLKLIFDSGEGVWHLE
jgi:hypothetical protein